MLVGCNGALRGSHPALFAQVWSAPGELLQRQSRHSFHPEDFQEALPTEQQRSLTPILRTEQEIRRMTMTLSRTLIAAALLSISAVNSASAQLPG
jgi:hypothetical protein